MDSRFRRDFNGAINLTLGAITFSNKKRNIPTLVST
jgi:hypothetical protein